jgi:hypothetical protein
MGGFMQLTIHALLVHQNKTPSPDLAAHLKTPGIETLLGTGGPVFVVEELSFVKRNNRCWRRGYVKD